MPVPLKSKRTSTANQNLTRFYMFFNWANISFYRFYIKLLFQLEY